MCRHHSLAQNFSAISKSIVSPVPTWVILLGFIGGGVARAALIGIIVTVVSLFFVDVNIHSIAVIVVTLLLTSTLFATAGLINGVFAKTFDDISVVPTFVLTPLTYLGGVFYSLSLLPDFWQLVSSLNPIVYMVNGFRYGFLGASDINHITALSLLVVFNGIVFFVAYRLVDKGVGIGPSGHGLKCLKPIVFSVNRVR